MNYSTSKKRTAIVFILTFLILWPGWAKAIALETEKATQKSVTIYYVNAASTTSNPDGNSWATAYTDLQSAVDAAEASGGGEVWVASGTYTSNDDPVLTMKEGVDLYGGFSGTESALEERNWLANPSVIDGEKERQCVIGADDALLHGFTITRGQASSGGGMYNENASPAVIHCSFMENEALTYGGAMYNRSASPTVTHSHFVENKAESMGGGLYNQSSFPTVTNCCFVQNQAARGGGIFNNYASPTVLNCTIVNNTANDTSGGMITLGSTPTVTNCIFWGNVKAQLSGPANVSYSCIQGGQAGRGNIDADPLFLSAPYSIQLQPESPCIDSGTATTAPENDILGRPRPQGDGIDMGAYEGAVLPDDQCTLTIQTDPEHLGKTAPPSGSHLFARGETVKLQAFTLGGSFSYWSGDIAGDTSPTMLLMDTDKTVTAHFQRNIVYVNGASTASNPDGSSWAKAYADLQSAVDAAEKAGGGELWVARGRYTGREDDVLIMKEGVALFGGFAGDETLPEQRDWEAQPTFIDGEEERRCVIGADLSLIDGFIITRGLSSYSGGMYNQNASPTVSNCTFLENEAWHGGGGMYNDSASPTVTNCTFLENTAVYGGGMFNTSSSPTVTNCTFLENDAYQKGGGMYCTSSSSPAVTNCSFVKNTSSASGGGGMCNNYSSPTVINCSFLENEASYGGGICNEYSSSPTVINCTFTGNHNDGIYNEEKASSVVTNSILWGNAGNQILGSAAVSYSCVENDYDGDFNIDADPLFLSAPYSIQLRPGSPCIDSGTAQGAPATDMLGRPRPQGAGIDMGACEGAVQPADQCTLNIRTEPADLGKTIPPAGRYLFARGDVVNLRAHSYGGPFSQWSGDISTASPGTTLAMDGNKTVTAHFQRNTVYVNAASTAPTPDGRSWAKAYTDLQSAVNAAEKAGGGEIWVAEGRYTSRENNVLIMKEGVTLYGGFSGTEKSRKQRNWKERATVIDGEEERCCVEGADHSLIDGFTFTRGNSPQGAGMWNNYCSPTVTNCSFVNNTASSGGGMYNSSSSPTVTNCSFVNNTAWDEGGGMDNFKSYPILTNCIFMENTADVGGAMYNNWKSSPTLMNCSLVGNAADSEGGGIYNDDCSITVTNSILWENIKDQIVNSSSAGASVSYSCIQDGYWGEGIIDNDPLFVEAPADLRLQPESPCIDAGTASGAPDTDILGHHRPQGVGIDMGAYEYYLGEDPEPIEGEFVEPNEGESTEPTEGESVEPSEGEFVDPTEGESVDPTEGESVDPTEGESTEPREGEFVDPNEGESVDPNEGEDKTDDDTSGCGCGESKAFQNNGISWDKLKHMLSDLLLPGISMLTLISFSSFRRS